MGNWFILIAIVLLVCIAEWIREIVTFRVTHYHIQSSKINSLNRERKIVFLSDLHNNRYGQRNEKLLEAIRLEHPDYILVGGDMLVGHPSASNHIAMDFVGKLTEICPVYYANGNHEQRMKLYPETYGTQYQEYKKALEEQGVQFLENDHIDLLWDDCEVQIHGLEIPKECYKKFKRNSLSKEQIITCIGEADAEKYQILMAHNPAHADVYKAWGADLVLSGHLHGGVVRIPGVGGVITPQFRFFPKYSGELTIEDNKAVVVSKGLGVHTFKIRFLNPAEVVVLHMGKA